MSAPHRPGPHGGEARLPAGAASVGNGGDGRRPAAGPPPSGVDPRASRWATAVTGAVPRLGRRRQALTRGRRRSEGAAPVGDPRRPGRAAGGPFLREGALMAHLHCSGSGVGE